METVSGNSEEYKARASRRNTRAQYMRQEKKLQQKRRRLTKLFIRIAARFFVIFAVISIVVAAIIKGGKVFLNQKVEVQDIPLNTSSKMPEAADIVEVSMDLVKRAGVAQILEQYSEDISDAPLANDEKEESLLHKSTQESIEEPALIHFTRTVDTAEIISEEIISSNAILIEESTNTIVASRKDMERISPASMTKVLTILVAAEQIAEEQLDDTFTMTKEITDYGYINDCSMVGFLEGEEIPLRDLFYGTILQSGADAALGLAIYVAGSQEAFVEMMNQKLEELGLADTAHFTNCVGLFDEEHYCTVYDMAVIMKAALQNELCEKYLSARTYTTAATPEHPDGIDISNWFIRRIEDKDTGGKVICAKTGYVVESGSCAVSYGYFGAGKPYICVTADSTTSWRCIYDHVEIYNQYIPG